MDGCAQRERQRWVVVIVAERDQQQVEVRAVMRCTL